MNAINHLTAVRAFNRVWAPIAEGLEFGRAVDYAIDGGEFSGKVNADLEQQYFDTYIIKVAERFGIDPVELEAAVYNYLHDNTMRFQEVHS